MRPKRNNESLHEYADAVLEDFRIKSNAHASSADEAWKMIFNEIVDEGHHVRAASPAAMVIYQRYFNEAVVFLHSFPDDDKGDELLRQVHGDLTGNLSKYSLIMGDENEKPSLSNFLRIKDGKDTLFTQKELFEGKIAYRRILSTLKSFA